jgi:hypothetical protein
MTVLEERFGIVLQKTEQLCSVKSDGSSNSKGPFIETNATKHAPAYHKFLER